MKKILVTSALPYANGDVHIGHLVEYIQTDIFVRFMKLTGRDVIYMCATDTHGTPIEVNARKQGKIPDKFVEEFSARIYEDFTRFHIQFDRFYTTNSEENRIFAEKFFQRLKDRGDIYMQEVDDLYDEKENRFLPDRFVKGTCPKCNAEDQYGDVCEKCNSTYTPMDLINPRSVLSGTPPVIKKTKHYFFDLRKYKDRLEAWCSSDHIQDAVKQYVQQWITDGLRPWDISREGPYFGFKIPGEENKFFYVWLDAPIGYISTTFKYCQEKNLDFSSYWEGKGKDKTLIYHFIGKDIIYFHTLFWPALLMGMDYNLPYKVQVHGMLTVNGEKMSKSRGTSITARTYLEHLDPQCLRYYYASKLTSRIDDLDLNLDELAIKVNAELVNNIANLYSRTSSFLISKLQGRLGENPVDTEALRNEFMSKAKDIYEYYEATEYSKAIREILHLADQSNKYFQDAAPWATLKDNPEAARNICTFTLNVCKNLAIMLKPVLPKLASDIEIGLNKPSLTWKDIGFKDTIGPISKSVRLIERMEQKNIEAMVEATKKQQTEQKIASDTILAAPIISIDEFEKLDLRVAEILDAKDIKGADKLLELILDVGMDKPKIVLAGIKTAYTKEQIVGKRILYLMNLAPRKMKFGESEGMILAAGPGGKDIFLCEIPGAKPGMKVK